MPGVSLGWNTGALPLSYCLAILIFDWLLFAFLSWYIPQVPLNGFLFCFNKKKSKKLANIQSGDLEDQPLIHGEGLEGVELSHVTKEYSQVKAVDDLSLTLKRGQITVLLGENGAGKSTTLSMLVGEEKLSAGDITVDRENMGVCFQMDTLFDTLTVREHLDLFSKIKQNTALDIEAAAKAVKLFESLDTRAKSLSGGQKRKLCLAIAMANSPDFLLLDEPTR